MKEQFFVLIFRLFFVCLIHITIEIERKSQKKEYFFEKLDNNNNMKKLIR